MRKGAVHAGKGELGREEAKRRFKLANHARATVGVKCRKDEGVLDETPAAYKDIDAVMAAQTTTSSRSCTRSSKLCA
jgi:tRNA-splicing ligase RtcB